jgi:hypothetical protein
MPEKSRGRPWQGGPEVKRLAASSTLLIVTPRNVAAQTAAHVLARRPLKSTPPVRERLTRNRHERGRRRRRERDTAVKLRDLERQVLAYAENANGEADTLPAFARLHDVVEAALRRVARDANGDGYSWAQIGDELGMSRQAAWERFR